MCQTDHWSQKRRRSASDPTRGSDTDSAPVDESVSRVITAPEDGGPSSSGPTPIHDTDPVGYSIGETHPSAAEGEHQLGDVPREVDEHDPMDGEMHLADAPEEDASPPGALLCSGTLSSRGRTSEAVGIQEDGCMISISSSSEEELDDSDSCIDDVKNLCERIMLEASAGLPSHITRGTINGVSGTYGATQINGAASKTTQWRRRKESEAALARRDGRDAAFKQHGTKSMVTHFFRRQSGSSETENDVTREELESNNSDASDSESSDSGDSGADEILDRRIRGFQASIPARLYRAPTIDEASESTTALLQLIRTRRGTGVGWKYTSMDHFSLKRLQQMLRLFRLYTQDPDFMGKWTRASRSVAVSEGWSSHYGRDLRRWCQNFVADHQTLPRSKLCGSPASALFADEDLKMEIITQLQTCGKYFSAANLLTFINEKRTLERLGRQKLLAIRTAQRWLKILEFRWRPEAKGMYSDGHEREDVVRYRQEKFLPAYHNLLARSAKFDDDGAEIPWELEDGSKEVIFHHHDETIFYGNDRRKQRWIHSSESPKPYAKGEGQSFMVADFVSSKFGWLSSPDGAARARVTLRPGKGRDGYFSNDEVVTQLSMAMDILDEHYDSYQHVFILDNARTHTKRAGNALSARHMPKNQHPTFGGKEVAKDSAGKPVLGQDGLPQYRRCRMSDATFTDGTAQPLYYPEEHPQFPGYFKGMTQILRERGFVHPEGIRAECRGFKCSPEASNCCQRRILFGQPDFVDVPSLAENLCNARGYRVIFLPKFHPELNFIEMCWGYGKRLYRELPPAPKIDEIEVNALWSLEQVPLISMRRWALLPYSLT